VPSPGNAPSGLSLALPEMVSVHSSLQAFFFFFFFFFINKGVPVLGVEKILGVSA
jgi:hypothetical protein